MHSATLGKGKKDDTLVRVKKGDLTGKGEVTLVFGKQVRFPSSAPNPDNYGLVVSADNRTHMGTAQAAR